MVKGLTKISAASLIIRGGIRSTPTDFLESIPFKLEITTSSVVGLNEKVFTPVARFLIRLMLGWFLYASTILSIISSRSIPTSRLFAILGGSLPEFNFTILI